MTVSGDRPTPTLVIHGGAGTLTRDVLTEAQRREHEAALVEALRAGERVLARGGTALDAVVEAVVSLEDAPQFNAGHGAVFTSAGTHELDASLMDGRTLRAGAVAGVTNVRNPVRAARVVMTRTPHVLMVGPSAERLAEAAGLEPVGPEYFATELRRAQLAEAKARDAGAVLDHDLLAFRQKVAAEKLGTVGAVALDAHGDLAAATSTGGLTNKLPGRVGDSPLVGAGVYADNRSVAASATGQGEKFIEVAGCHRLAMLVEIGRMDLREAADEVISRALAGHGGRGGIIAVDRRGRVAMPFNTPGMFRGVVRVGAEARVAIFDDEAIDS